MIENNDIVFGTKTLHDILANIYSTTEDKRAQINTMIIKLMGLVKTPEEASVIFPIIRNLMDTSVRNDHHIIDIAEIALKKQMAVGKLESDNTFSDAEKENLLKLLMEAEVDELQKETNNTVVELDAILKDGSAKLIDE